MTRINLVDPSLLRREHLIAEYRELPRVFGLVRNALSKGKTISDFNIEDYRMGEGHILFFYKRLGFLLRRQNEIIRECMLRGYKIKYEASDDLSEGIPEVFLGDWSPSERDIEVNLERINQRGGLKCTM